MTPKGVGFAQDEDVAAAQHDCQQLQRNDQIENPM
jgi:hypothetical protein